jgi:U4/U6.U5 tri-snRNP component SNU23
MEKKKINVSEHLKKVQLLNSSVPLSDQGGFHCPICQASFKNHSAFLDHQNSRVHLLNTGYNSKESLKPARVDTVKSLLQKLKRKHEQEKISKDPVEQMEKRIENALTSEENTKRVKYAKKKANKRRKAEERDTEHQI